jgi:hypothetical protein
VPHSSPFLAWVGQLTLLLLLSLGFEVLGFEVRGIEVLGIEVSP